MELDKRILKNPLSGFDTDKAKMYLYSEKKGYFGCYVDDFQDLRALPFETLRLIKDGFFSCDEDEEHMHLYSFFLPEDYVSPVPKEDQYRPFTLEEFCSKFPLLSAMTFREKRDGTIQEACFLGYTKYNARDCEPYVAIGNTEFRLSELFDGFELLDTETNDYVPFGIKER